MMMLVHCCINIVGGRHETRETAGALIQSGAAACSQVAFQASPSFCAVITVVGGACAYLLDSYSAAESWWMGIMTFFPACSTSSAWSNK
jgi:hypothetical protein